MKAALITAALGGLAVAQYPANWIDFNGGTNSGSGGSPNMASLSVKDPKADEAAKMTFPAPNGGAPKDKGGAKGIGSLGDILGGIGLSMPKGGAGNAQGSGPYPAKATSDPSLPGHTIFAPVAPPTGVKFPVIVWGNGGCLGVGTVHGNLLTEFASQGYYVVANGKIDGSLMAVTFSNNTDLFDAVNWVTEQTKSGKLSYVDSTKIASMGQSCGGMQAYTAGQDKRVTQTVIVNSGLMGNASTLRAKLSVIDHPIGYFLGGKPDMAYAPGLADFISLKTPATLCSMPVGHGGTLAAANGGSWGVAITAWLNWQMKGNDTIGKQWFLNEQSPLYQQGWDVVQFKNFK